MVVIVRSYAQLLSYQELEISKNTLDLYIPTFTIYFTGWSLLIKCKKETFYDVDILCFTHFFEQARKLH